MERKAGEPRAADTFEGVAREWFLKFSKTWAESHSTRIMRRFERDVFPWIGKRPIDELNAQDVLRVLRWVEGRDAIETAHRALENCSRVFRCAVATGRAERDPCTDLRGALAPARTTHFAAATEPEQAAQILRITHSYQGTYVVACALRLAPLVFVQPGELRKARWADTNLETAEWRFRISKTETNHIVPLARQAVTILRDLRQLTGHSTFVFPSARSDDRPMSDNAVLGALHRLGIAKTEMTGHGVRAMARTILDEVLKFRPDLIEHQLAHAVRDPLGRAYNRTAHLPERRAMMQAWADYLDSLRTADGDHSQVNVSSENTPDSTLL